MDATTGVLKTVDVRAFPMEIAKRMLTLGVALSMTKGPTAFFEAEKSLISYLDAISVYHYVIFGGKTIDFRMQQRFVERFVSMHASNPNLLESQARQLLDSIHYFPEAKDEGTNTNS